jgi:hypothetical protein
MSHMHDETHAASLHETPSRLLDIGAGSRSEGIKGDVMSGWRPFGNVIVDDVWA